jgi:chemotaxis protein CheY-P-specific phosphatase CheC
MRETLTDYEFGVARQLLHIALANAAAAFSKMAAAQVAVKDFKVFIPRNDGFTELLQDESGAFSFMLTTEMKGDLSAKSYLVFNQSAINALNKIFLQAATHTPEGELSPLQQSALLELDNILSAAVITQIADLLKVFVYGDVPYLYGLSKKDMAVFFHQDAAVYNPALCMQAKFHLSHMPVASSFLWLFRTDFLLSVKELVKHNQHVNLIRQF